MTLHSVLYSEKLKDYHASREWGVTVQTKISAIDDFASENNVQSILDYGCGTGILKKKLGHKYRIDEYDIGIEGKDVLTPDTYDMIVCVDVAEHFETETIYSNFDAIYHRANKCVYMTISCEPSNENFPDGTNLHLSVREPWEWLQTIQSLLKPKRINFAGTSNGLIVKIKM